jgi:hypothetical protein
MQSTSRHALEIVLTVLAPFFLASPVVAQDGFASLVDGKTLRGWERHNGTANYTVEGEEIVGRTSEGSPNSFLCTEKEFGDFELTFEVKVDDALNSGVQFRSSVCGKNNGRVHGPQVEIATNGSAGYVYGEALDTGWLSEDPRDDATRAFKNGEWNTYRVLAKGKRIQTWVNNVQVVDFVDEESGMSQGFIALQVHGIGRGEGPYEVRWRKLMVKELD